MTALLLAYLFNAAWQAPLIALGAWLLGRMTDVSARWRCWGWVGFLVMAVVSPALREPFGALQIGQLASLLPGRGATAALPLHRAGAVAAGMLHASVRLSPFAAHLLIFAAMVPIVVCAAWLAAGLARARAMVARSTPFDPPLSGTAGLAALAAGRRQPQVRCSADVAGPVVIGAFRPVILAPRGFETLPEQEASAALLHEYAHIVRRDYALNLACEVLALPLSWHPAVGVFKAGLRTAREIACDERASAQMACPSTYARCLVSLARSIGPATRGQAFPELALLGRGDLEARVRALVRRGAIARKPALARDLLMTGCVLAVIGGSAAILRVSPTVGSDPSVGGGPTVAASTLVHRVPVFVRTRDVGMRLAEATPHAEPNVVERRVVRRHKLARPTSLALLSAPAVSEDDAPGAGAPISSLPANAPPFSVVGQPASASAGPKPAVVLVTFKGVCTSRGRVILVRLAWRPLDALRSTAARPSAAGAPPTAGLQQALVPPPAAAGGGVAAAGEVAASDVESCRTRLAAPVSSPEALPLSPA